MRVRTIQLVRYIMIDCQWVAELVTGLYVDKTETYWRIEVNGELHAYPRSAWTRCAA